MSRPLVIGLTGGIGSGKSTIADLFRELGVPIIDTDVIARKVVEPGKPAYNKIISVFGSEVLAQDGQLNRSRISEWIYREPALRKQLESIVHPDVIREMQDCIAAVAYPYCIVVIPLLLEAGLTDQVDRILVVDTDEATQLSRTLSRDNRSEKEIRSIIAAQASRQERITCADDVIDNSGEMDRLVKEVRTLHNSYLSLCHRSGLRTS